MQNRSTRSAHPSSPVPALMFAVSVVGSNGLALSPILSDVARSYSTSPLTISTAISAYGAATAASAFFLASRIDRIGIRRSLLGAMAALIVALVLSACAPHWIVLTLAQALAGAAAGVILPAAYGSASLIAPPGQEARTLGRVIAGWSVSLVAGVPLSALISDAVGWRATYGTLALCAAIAVLGLRKLPERRVANPAPLRLARLLAPLSYRDVPALLLGCLAFSSAFYGVYAFLADHVRSVLALSAGQVGFIAFAYGAGFLVAGVAGAPLIERLGPRRALPLALGIIALVYVGLL
ncbi:MFS transporter, partial [Achromobacter insolitus]